MTGSYGNHWFAPNHVFHNHTLELQVGDRLVIYSDGLMEACNEAHEEFGEHGIVTFLHASRNHPLQEVVDGLAMESTNWQTKPITDDISILAMEVL